MEHGIDNVIHPIEPPKSLRSLKRKENEQAFEGHKITKKAGKGKYQNTLWTPQAEKMLLKGIHKFKNQGGNPSNYLSLLAFFDGSLGVHLTPKQVRDKVSKLKKKYKKNINRDNFLNRHEARLYRLSNRLWGNESKSEETLKVLQSEIKALRSSEKELEYKSDEIWKHLDTATSEFRDKWINLHKTELDLALQKAEMLKEWRAYFQGQQQ